MRMTRALLPLLILAGAAIAQDNERLLAGDVLTQELCERMRDDVMPRIELFTRMKFRRGVPMRLEPKGVWENKIKRDGFAGTSAKHALAYYTPSRNVVTVVPWVIGGYAGGNPSRRSRVAWISELEPTMIHELTHAIHHQNFYTEGRFYAASLRAGGLSEEELDRSTVDFLMGEGVPELVALRTTDFKERMHRHPGRDLPSPLNYMRKYQPDGKKAYRIKLLEHGYRDGLDLMHHLALKSGPRGIRAVLYRPPPRQLVFQPKILATVELDDPPEPDSIFGFLSPEILKGREILRATFPGHGRYFESACQPRRTKGCLIGYVATVGDEGSKDGQSRYAFFVADPDKPSPWVGEQLAALKGINPGGVKEKQVDLPLTKGIKATHVTVKTEDGGLYVYAAHGGLVVIAHETKPTRNLDRRVVYALSGLFIKRPTPDLYKAATEEAKRQLSTD